jgi:ADP-ribosyl-[dinitrogen reductase] hydrolase
MRTPPPRWWACSPTRCGAGARPGHWLKRLVPEMARAVTQQARALVEPFL